MNKKEVWIMLLQYSAKYQHMDSFHLLHEAVHPKPLEDYLPTPTSGLLLPSQRNHLDDILQVPALVYNYVSSGQVSMFEMAADMLLQIYNHEPQCCSYRKFYRLLLGINMKMLMEALREDSDRVLGEFNKHMPRDGFHHHGKDSHDCEKTNATIKDFRRFFLPLILDRDAREKYFSTQYEAEFGATYMQQLTELTKSVLSTIVSHLPPCQLEELFNKKSEIPEAAYLSACHTSPALKIVFDFIRVTEKLDGQSLMKLLKLLADQDQLPEKVKDKLMKSVRGEPELLQTWINDGADFVESPTLVAANKKAELVGDFNIESEQCLVRHHDSNNNCKRTASDHRIGAGSVKSTITTSEDICRSKGNRLKDLDAYLQQFSVKRHVGKTNHSRNAGVYEKVASSIEKPVANAADKENESNDSELEGVVAQSHDSNGNCKRKANDQEKGTYSVEMAESQPANKENDPKDHDTVWENFEVKRRANYTGCKPKLSAHKHPDFVEKTSGKVEMIQGQATLHAALDTNCPKNQRQTILVDVLDINRKKKLIQTTQENLGKGVEDHSEDTNSANFQAQAFAVKSFYSKPQTDKTVEESNTGDCALRVVHELKPTTSTRYLKDSLVINDSLSEESEPESSDSRYVYKVNRYGFEMRKKRRSSQSKGKRCARGKLRQSKHKKAKCTRGSISVPAPNMVTRFRQKCLSNVTNQSKDKAETHPKNYTCTAIKTGRGKQIENDENNNHARNQNTETISSGESQNIVSRYVTHSEIKCSGSQPTICDPISSDNVYVADSTGSELSEEDISQSHCTRKTSFNITNLKDYSVSLDSEDAASTCIQVGDKTQQTQSVCKRKASNSMNNLENDNSSDSEDTASTIIGYETLQNITGVTDIDEPRNARVASWCDANATNLGLDRDCALQAIGSKSLLDRTAQQVEEDSQIPTWIPQDTIPQVEEESKISLDRTAQQAEENSRMPTGVSLARTTQVEEDSGTPARIRIRFEGWEVHSIVAPSVRSEDGSDMQLDWLEEDLEYEDNNIREIVPDFKKFLG